MFKKIFFFSLAVFMAVSVPLSTQALVAEGQDSVRLEQTQIIDGNYFVAGSNVEIAGQVNGDVFVAGSNIIITGTINGDLFAAGSNIIISGQINGNARLAGSSIQLSGQVERNLMAMSASLMINDQARVGRHLTFAGASLNLNGEVNGNLEAAAEQVNLNNKIGGQVQLKMGETGKLNIQSQAILEKDLYYTSGQTAEISDQAQISGQINYQPFEVKVSKTRIFGLFVVGYFMSKVISLFSLFLLGLLFVYLMPKPVKKMQEFMITKPWQVLGQGLIWFILTPIVCLLLLFTVIGIPLGLIGFLTYGIALYMAKVISALALGAILVKSFKWHKVKPIGEMIIGVIVYVALASIPVIGWLVCLLAVLWGLGGLVYIKKQSLKELN